MKELSIEEKAKRFNEALKAAVVAHKDEDKHLKATLERIFPELKESEGDRIRKVLVDYFKKYKEQEECGIKTFFGIPTDNIITWLEKQGEQKPQGKTALEAINEEKVDNANKVEPRQEKLTEFERAVKQVMEEAIECGNTHNLKADAEMLLSLVHKPAEEPVWYDNMDDLIADGMIDEIQKSNLSKGSKHNRIYWIKKHRVQPKQEWSEEDKKIIDRIESEFLALHRGDYKNIDFNDVSSLTVLNWVRKIKSLRFQNTWKPSGEQMAALKFVIESLDNMFTAIGYMDNYTKPHLEEILEALKKLREE